MIVIEGMPEAGETSAVGVLERSGHQVVGEYVSERPGVDDDEAHERNWIVKTVIAEQAATSVSMAAAHCTTLAQPSGT